MANFEKLVGASLFSENIKHNNLSDNKGTIAVAVIPMTVVDNLSSRDRDRRRLSPLLALLLLASDCPASKLA